MYVALQIIVAVTEVIFKLFRPASLLTFLCLLEALDVDRLIIREVEILMQRNIANNYKVVNAYLSKVHCYVMGGILPCAAQ